MPKLKAPHGVSNASVGETQYVVDQSGEVDAAEVDTPFLEAAGFQPEAQPLVIPEGQVAVRHPEGGSCSFGGVSYEPNADGVVIVPAAAVEVLASHGFDPVPAAQLVPVSEPEPEPAPASESILEPGPDPVQEPVADVAGAASEG